GVDDTILLSTITFISSVEYSSQLPFLASILINFVSSSGFSSKLKLPDISFGIENSRISLAKYRYILILLPPLSYYKYNIILFFFRHYFYKKSKIDLPFFLSILYDLVFLFLLLPSYRFDSLHPA